MTEIATADADPKIITWAWQAIYHTRKIPGTVAGATTQRIDL